MNALVTLVPWLIAAFVVGLATARWCWGNIADEEPEAETTTATMSDAPVIHTPPAATPPPLPDREETPPPPVATVTPLRPLFGFGQTDDDWVPIGQDDLTRITGIDAPMARLLNGVGISRFQDIAQWHAPEIARIEAALGQPGRIMRERWMEQAQLLAGMAPERTALRA